MKAHVLKHNVCAPNDITVLPPANQSTCAKTHPMPLNCHALAWLGLILDI